jgi:uncharacterized protein (TIGR02217 family)
MPITVLSDVILPNSVLSSGVRGKNMRMNARNMTNNGFGTVNIVWSKTLRQYELGTVPMLVAQWQAIEGLHEITEGGAYGFLMQDPKDNTTYAGEGKISLAGGIYQLQKRYVTSGSSRYKDRAITRPRATGFVLTYDSVVMSSGYTLYPLTGQVTFSTPPADPTLLGWTGIFYVPVHFMDDAIDWDLVSPGRFDTRLLAGPAVVLMEIRE